MAAVHGGLPKMLFVRTAPQACRNPAAGAATGGPTQPPCFVQVAARCAVEAVPRQARSAARKQPPAAISLGSAAGAVAMALSAAFPGETLAAEDAPKELALPPLPTPPEVVRTLSETIFSGPEPPSSEQAPPLKDSPNGSGGQVNGGGEKKSGTAGKNGGEQAGGLSKQDGELEARFESQILPKIQEQLRALDQNESPNAATIELKRQLRRAEDDIYRLLDDLKNRKSDAARAEASGLAREFEDIREYVRQNGGVLSDEEK